MASANLIAGWVMVLLGFIVGAIFVIFAPKEDWLGGYTSSRRRLLRLGHIALIALGTLNIIVWLVLKTTHPSVGGLHDTLKIPLRSASQNLTAATNSLCGLPALMAGLFLLGGVLMPITCFLSAMDFKWQYLFSLPAVFLIAGAILMIILLL